MNYTPESQQQHAILNAMCQQFGLSYEQAFQSYAQLTEQGCVPAIDWSKIPSIASYSERPESKAKLYGKETANMSQSEYQAATRSEAIQQIARQEQLSPVEAYQEFYQRNPSHKEWWMN